MITKKFEELTDIDVIVATMYARIPTLRGTKFGYAYTKFNKKYYQPTLTELQDRLADIQISHALEDKNTKEILTDEKSPRKYKFTKEELKKCIEEENASVKEFNAKDIEIEPYISSFVPEGITDAERETLTGIVL